MFHYKNLGMFGTELEEYADLDGFLPSCFEDLLEMNYELCGEELDEDGVWDEDCRSQFWEEASEAISEAEEKLSEWQKENAGWAPPFCQPSGH